MASAVPSRSVRAGPPHVITTSTAGLAIQRLLEQMSEMVERAMATLTRWPLEEGVVVGAGTLIARDAAA